MPGTGDFSNTNFQQLACTLQTCNLSNGQDEYQRFADLDNDGDLDIIVSQWSGDILIYQNNGGIYNTASPLVVGAGNAGTDLNWRGVGLMDWDGDGWLDFYSINYLGPASYLWLNQNQAGDEGVLTGFISVTDTNSSGGDNLKIEAADMTGNGTNEVLIAHEKGFAIREATPAGFYPFEVIFGRTDLTGGDIATADFNGDGHMDFVWAESANPARRFVYLNDGTGNGSFSLAPETFPNSTPAFDVATGDIDGNLTQDIVFTGPTNGTEVWLNDGTGDFTRSLAYPTLANIGGEALAVGDLNDDGRLDIVLNGSPNTLVYIQNTNDTFDLRSSINVQGAKPHIELGDVDGDQGLDIATSYSGNRTGIWYNNNTTIEIDANFEPDRDFGGVPLTVHFTDLSTAVNTTITSWEWDFDGDNQVDSTQQNPTFTYFNAGSYLVTLEVSDGTNSDRYIRTLPIVVDSDPCATDCPIDLLWEEVSGGINRAVGNVGVNNATPAYPLDVNGNVNAAGYLINGVAIREGLWEEASNGAYYTSNVGIGTSTIEARLDVDNGNVFINKSKNDVNVIIDGVDLDNVLYFDGGRNAIGMGAIPNPAAVLDVAVKPMSVTSNGTNVRIGMIGRLYNLDIGSGIVDSGLRIGLLGRGVVEDAAFQGTLNQSIGIMAESGMTAGTGTVTNAIALFVDNFDSGTGTITNHYGVYQPRNFVTNFFNGNVGIKTTNPQGALDVNGEIYQRGTLLHADYVFAPDYNLLSIEEQGAFMENNQHLPAVPKAEVDANGKEVLKVGAHRRGMLEELEKAHLYIQQLNDHLQSQEAELDALRSMVERLTTR
jgi:PKD repeat protein